MEAGPPDIPCRKCRKNIIATNFVLHQLRCPGEISGSTQRRVSSKIFGNKSGLRESKGLRREQPKPVDIQRIPCHQCGFLMTLQELDLHPQLCESKQTMCSYCNESFPEIIMEDHYEVCEAKDSLEGFMSLQNSQQSEEGEDHEQEPNAQNGFGSFGQSIFDIIRNMMRSLGIEDSGGLDTEEMHHIKNIKYERVQTDVDQCSICFVEFQQGEQISRLQCRHLYHPDCIGKWLGINSLCPVCKRDVRQS